MNNENSLYEVSIDEINYTRERIRENLKYKKEKKDFKKIIYSVYEKYGLIKKKDQKKILVKIY